MVNAFVPSPKLEAEFADVRCVGIGESGLHTTAPDLDVQKILLKKVATASWVHGKTLVLYVRGKSNEIDQLFKTVLFILDSSIVPGTCIPTPAAGTWQWSFGNGHLAHILESSGQQCGLRN